jgi:hypothetical protein
MRTITTTAGTPLELDGDVLAVIEAVSRDLLRRQALEYGSRTSIGNSSPRGTDVGEELRAYLKESLFMSFNRYENEQLAALLRRADRADTDHEKGVE